MKLSPFREKYLETSMDLMGVLYLWAGKDHGGLDCSGHYTFPLFIASSFFGHPIDLRFSHNTDLLLKNLEPITEDELLPGDAILYGTNPNDPEDADHVMTYLSPEFCIGACGGGPRITSPAAAKQANAKVKAKFFYRYRRDEVLGYRRLPQPPHL